jgi:glycosyltransferase involved in cell wall biosynthesis
MTFHVLISCPSLDVKTNVSGIAALVRPLVLGYPTVFYHLCVGTPDGRKGALDRALYLLKAIRGLIIFATSRTVSNKRFHLNTAADTPSLFRDVILLGIARILCLRVVVHFHGGKWITTPHCPWFAMVLVRVLCNWGNSCVVLGLDEADILRDKFGVLRAITILPNFVSPDFVCEPKSQTKVPLTMLFLGRFVGSKLVDKLPDLLRMILVRVPGSQMIVCGDGPLREQLLADFSKLPSSAWSYRGVVSGAEKIDVLRQADIFILPSVTGEGMPIAMLEAMASGAIPVVTRLGAIPNVIKHAQNGFIAEPGDLEGFSNCVVDALTSPRREEVRRIAYDTALEYSIDVYRARLDVIYGSV